MCSYFRFMVFYKFGKTPISCNPPRLSDLHNDLRHLWLFNLLHEDILVPSVAVTCKQKILKLKSTN